MRNDWFCLHAGAFASHCVVDEQNDDRSDYRDKDAVKIHARHAYVPHGTEQPARAMAPIIPNTMSITTPWPVALTILLAMKPEMSPRTIYDKNDIADSCDVEHSKGDTRNRQSAQVYQLADCRFPRFQAS